MSHIADGPDDTQNEGASLDVTNLTLADLLTLDHSALSNAIRRAVADAQNQQEAHASWSSYQP